METGGRGRVPGATGQGTCTESDLVAGPVTGQDTVTESGVVAGEVEKDGIDYLPRKGGGHCRDLDGRIFWITTRIRYRTRFTNSTVTRVNSMQRLKWSPGNAGENT